MLHLEALNPEAAALDCVLTFLEHLAQDEWEAALSILDLPTSYGQAWSRREIELELQAYNGAAATVTSPALALGKRHTSTGRFNDGSGFYLDIAIPINGQWSDLTAQFEFKIRQEGYGVALESLHVL